MTHSIKILFVLSLTISVGLFVFATQAIAAGADRPFGAYITLTSLPPYQCPSGEGPITQRTIGQSGGSNYYSTNAGSRSWVGSLGPKAWVLGFYSSTPSSECFVQIGTVRKILETIPYLKYGTSLR